MGDLLFAQGGTCVPELLDGLPADLVSMMVDQTRKNS
jgi:hypothetical protein